MYSSLIYRSYSTSLPKNSKSSSKAYFQKRIVIAPQSMEEHGQSKTIYKIKGSSLSDFWYVLCLIVVS